MNNKIIATLMITTMILGMIPVEAIINTNNDVITLNEDIENNEAGSSIDGEYYTNAETEESIEEIAEENILQDADINETGKSFEEELIEEALINELSDGIYAIPVEAKNEKKPEEDSTANEYLDKSAFIYVENGKMMLELVFKGAGKIKEISAEVNQLPADDMEVVRDDDDNVSLRFSINSLDDEIVLSMKINPFGIFSVSARAIINLDKDNIVKYPNTSDEEEAEISDGIYTIPVEAKNESKPEEDSTANTYLDKNASIYVENGKMTLELVFKGAGKIKEISAEVNGSPADNMEVARDDEDNITLKFSINSLDDKIILLMRINPFGAFEVSAGAIINLDKDNLAEKPEVPEDKPDIDKPETNKPEGSTPEGEKPETSIPEESGSLKEGIVYTIENMILKENSSENSDAGQFFNKTSNLEYKNGMYYVTLKSLSGAGSLMSNQRVTVDGVETSYETLVNDNNGNWHIRIPVKSINSNIRISVYVNQTKKTYTFRLKLVKDSIKDPDGNSIVIEDDDNTFGNWYDFDNAPELDLTNEGTYKASLAVIGSDGNKNPLISGYIQDYSIIEVSNNNLYAYLLFSSPAMMSYRTMTVNGENAVFTSSVTSTGLFKLKVKLNSINDEIEFSSLLISNINDGFKVKINGNILEEYIEPSNNESSSSRKDNIDDGTYTIKNNILKENSNSESTARDYVDKESVLEVDDGDMDLTLKFIKGSLMSNVSVKVAGKSVTTKTVKKSGDKYYIKFPINSLSDEILVSAKINIMGGMNVKFRVELRKNTLKEDEDAANFKGSSDETIDETEVKTEINVAENVGEAGGSVTIDENGEELIDSELSELESYTKTIYSIKNEIISDSDIGYQAARDAIGDTAKLEVINNKIYLTLNIYNTDLMSNIRVKVDGSAVKYNTFNKNVENNTMDIRFEIADENSDITITSYIGMISRDISFGVKLLSDTKTFIKSEEITSSQVNDISNNEESDSNFHYGNTSSVNSLSNTNSDMIGNSLMAVSQSGVSQVIDQLTDALIDASEYFKRFTIGNEIISDSTMGRTMARKYLNETSILEEIDGQYYITFTFVGTSAMDNFRFTVNGADVEYKIVLNDEENGIKSFKFPISSVNDNIQSYIFIKPVKMNIDFGIKLLEDTMVLVEEGTVGSEEGTQDSSNILNDIVDKATKDSSTGEVSAMKIAVSTSALTIILNQLLGLVSSFLKRKKSLRLLKKVSEK